MTGAPPMSDFASIKACVFDAYGTMFDVHSIGVATQQLAYRGLNIVEVSWMNAFRPGPARGHESCDRLGAGAVKNFLWRWIARLPSAFTVTTFETAIDTSSPSVRDLKPQLGVPVDLWLVGILSAPRPHGEKMASAGDVVGNRHSNVE